MYKGRSHYSIHQNQEDHEETSNGLDSFLKWFSTHNLLPILFALIGIISTYYGLLNKIDTLEQNQIHDREINTIRFNSCVIKGEVQGISTSSAKLTPITITPTIKL